MMRRQAGGRGGFTLIEVLIALGILAGAAVALVRLHTGALQSDARARGLSLAVMVAQEKMEEALLPGEYELGTVAGEKEVASSLLRWQRSISDVMLPTGGRSGLEKISVRVLYPAAGRQLEYEVVTFRVMQALPIGGIGGALGPLEELVDQLSGESGS